MDQIDMQLNYDIDNIVERISLDKKSFVQSAEKNYKQGVEAITKQIAKNISEKNLLLVCGPSSSGKTTTSNIIVNTLANLGISALVVSMDNFFIEREETPLLPNGAKDYDNVKTINIELFKKCLNELIEKGTTKLPIFDFITGHRQDDVVEVTMRKNMVIIVEGLHVLNPLCISQAMQQKAIKIFVCPKSGFNKNNKTLISSTSLRFTRRMIRDFCSRGYSVNETEINWQGVIDAEKQFITPYKKDADFIIDTTHAYEPFLYNQKMLELLEKDRDFAKYIVKDIPKTELTSNDISSISLIWEFLGA